MNDSPVEITIKTGRKKKIVFHCGLAMRGMSVQEQESSNGWCATKVDRSGKIERWGYCNDACRDDKECEIMFKPMGGSKQAILLSNKYDICAGKKHPFPHSIISFERRKKRKSAIAKEKSEAKKNKVSARNKPTQF